MTLFAFNNAPEVAKFPHISCPAFPCGMGGGWKSHHRTPVRGSPRHHRFDCGGQPVLSDQSVLKSDRQSHPVTVAGAADGHPVAVDFYVRRPVDQYIHAPTPLFLRLMVHPSATSCLFSRRALLTAITPQPLDVQGLFTRAAGEVRSMLFRFCSGRKSVHPHPNSRAPTRANASADAQSPRTPTSADVTPLRPS